MTENPIQPIKESAIPTAKNRAVKLARRHGIDALIAGKQTSSTFSQRAKARQQVEAAQQQKNLEQILALVEKQCSDEAGSEVDPDWFNAYLTLASNSQSRAMQQLWSQILTKEIVTPGSFSVKALNTLTQMTQREAMWFQRACLLSSQLGNDPNNKLVVGALRPASNLGLRRTRLAKVSLGKHRLSYSQLMQLAELGLLFERELETTPAAGQDLVMTQSGQRWLMRPRGKATRILYYRMTHIGDELAQLIPVSPIENYQQELIEELSGFFEIQR
jgi:uncharacterized repeat protein (TIGR03899 family)